MFENCMTLRKDGRYMWRFHTGRKENEKESYQYVYGSTYEEAEIELKIAREVENLYTQHVNISVEQGYSEWIAAALNRVKESSCANYVKKFKKHMPPAIESAENITAALGRKTDKLFKLHTETTGLSSKNILHHHSKVMQSSFSDRDEPEPETGSHTRFSNQAVIKTTNLQR